METTILWCRSLSTGREFPVAQLSADTDTATNDLVSLTSTEKPEILVTTLTANEYKSGNEGLLNCEARINKELGRSDLRVAFLVRTEEMSPPAKGLSFREFKKRYKPALLFYRDLLTGSGEATVVREETEREFCASGGMLVRHEV